MKKLLAMLLALVMVLSLAACGEKTNETEAPTKAPETQAPAQSGDDKTEAPTEAEKSDWLGTEDGKTITLRFWGGVQPEYGYDQLCANFNEEYKDRGLQVEYIRYVNDSQGNLQLETYLLGGGEVDIFMGYGGRSTMDKRAEANLILEFSDMLEARNFDLIENLGQANMASYIYDDGSVWGFPTKYENGNWILANVDMFKAAGLEVPYDGWTYSEYLEACEKLTHGEGQEKVYAICYTFKQSKVNWLGIMESVLGKYYQFTDDSMTVINWDTPEMREGLNVMVETLDKGWAISMEDDITEGMTVANTYVAGKCAMSTCVSQMRIVMDTVNYPHDFVTAIIPAPVPDDEKYNTEFYRTHAKVTGAGDLFCIAAKTEYPEQCVEFGLWYLCGGMSPLAKGGRIPLWNGLDSEAVIQTLVENANGSIDLDSMRNYLGIDKTSGITGLVHPKQAELGTIQTEEWEELCYRRQDVDQFIKDMNTRQNELINQK